MLNPLPWLKPLLGFLKALIAPVVGFKLGESREKAKQATDALERGEDGRQGAQQAQQDLDSGKTPEQIVRDNDGKWD